MTCTWGLVSSLGPQRTSRSHLYLTVAGMSTGHPSSRLTPSSPSLGPHVTLPGLSEFCLASSEPTGQEQCEEWGDRVWGVNITHLALATHSRVTSEVPATTLVFLGGMMMVGAMGSAGPPTSGERSGVGWGLA